MLDWRDPRVCNAKQAQLFIRQEENRAAEKLEECYKMRAHSKRAIFFIVATLAVFPPAFAQIYGPSTEGKRSPQAMKAVEAAPKPKYEAHDLSGVWWARGNDILMG